MKKTLLILSACLCFFTSCQKKQKLKPINIKPITIEQDGCTIVSDPRLELLLIASNLAGFYPIGNTNSDYVSTIHTFFKNHKEHALIKQIKKITKKYTYYIDYLMIFNCISEDFTTISEETLHNSAKNYWKKHKDQFLKNFNSFAHDTNFAKFYLAFEHTLKAPLFHAKDYFNTNPTIIPNINSILTKNNNQKQIIYSSNLAFSNYPTTIPNTLILENKPNKENPFTKFWLFSNLLYNSIFKSIEENWEQLKEPITTFVKTLYEQNRITLKIEDTNTILLCSDIMSFYLTYHFTAKDFPEEINTEIYEFLKKQYLYDFYTIFKPIFQEYEQNPEKYASFEEFFNNYLVNEIINISLN